MMINRSTEVRRLFLRQALIRQSNFVLATIAASHEEGPFIPLRKVGESGVIDLALHKFDFGFETPNHLTSGF